jgi:hypothetical protein
MRLQVRMIARKTLNDIPAIVSRTVVDHQYLVGGPRLAANMAKGVGQISCVIIVAKNDRDGAHSGPAAWSHAITSVARG